MEVEEVFGGRAGFDYVFMTRTFWLEMNVPNTVVLDKYKEYFGEKRLSIDDRAKAVTYLSQIVGKLQEKFVARLKEDNVKNVVKDFYKILDEVWHFYFKQKEARNELTKLRANDSKIGDTFELNRNIALNVIDATNLWLENCILYQEKIKRPYDTKSFEVNKDLFVELYIYGATSRALSLISMSKKFGERKLFYGINVDINKDEPLEIIKYHPIIYFNPLLLGNQNNIPITAKELEKSDESGFGIGFKEEYGISFLYAMKTISTIECEMLKKGKYAFTVVEKKYFLQWIEHYTSGLMDANLFFECFSIDKEKIQTHLRKQEPIIWIMGANKYRHEIRPIICFDDDTVAISYAALEQAKQLWLSIFSNGGMAYSTTEDELTKAIEKRNEELSDKLVDILREKLRNHYFAEFDEIDVQYYRIFGEKNYNYGDYDLVFYSKQEKELFLIEAKFFSDSLNNSGMISDYEKMFKKNGYYDHCRKRYELVLKEPQKMKDFIGATEKVKVHCLFVSSKPLEIEFQDEDEIVTFPCLSIFDDYLEGKLLPEVGDTPVRPVHII